MRSTAKKATTQAVDKARAQRDAAKREAIARSRQVEETVGENREQAAQNRGR